MPNDRNEFPWPNERERSGLRQIRTGNVTSVHDAECADRWIDRLLTAMGMRVTAPMPDDCSTCGGAGRTRDGDIDALRMCPNCNGSGLQ